VRAVVKGLKRSGRRGVRGFRRVFDAATRVLKQEKCSMSSCTCRRMQEGARESECDVGESDVREGLSASGKRSPSVLERAEPRVSQDWVGRRVGCV
jgi:hypothetical protein